MSVKNTNTNKAEPWRSVKIRQSVYEAIDKQLHKAQIQGAQKYDSVPAFIHTAILRLLEHEGLEHKKVAEVITAR